MRFLALFVLALGFVAVGPAAGPTEAEAQTKVCPRARDYRSCLQICRDCYNGTQCVSYCKRYFTDDGRRYPKRRPSR